MLNGTDHEHEEHASESSEDLLDLNEVMRAFGIDAWQNLGPVAGANANSLSLLVSVEGQNYVLRERPEGMLGEDIDHRYRFQLYLQQAGIPIPTLWRTPGDEPFVVMGEDAFELQRWPDGVQFATADPQNLTWIASSGAMLGRIHQASRLYTGPVHRWPSEAHMGGVVQSYLNLAHNRADEHPVQAVASALADWAEQWEAVLPAAMMSIGAGQNLPSWHIHGDYHAQNLRFGSAGITSVLGLEASRWEKRLFEVASSLFYFSALAWEADNSLTRPLVKRGFDPERARLFLQAYGEYEPPMPGEAALLVDALMLVSPIATINGPLEDLFYTQESLDESLIEDVLERLSWATSLPAWLGRVRRSLPEMWE